MLWTIIGIIVILILSYRAYSDDNRDVVSWRSGNKGEAILWFLLYCFKAMLFEFFLQLLVIFFFTKN